MFVLVFLIFLNIFDDCLAHGRIVGGRSAKIEEYPYQLSLRFRNRHICGATLIANNVAITAAHCIPMSGSYTVKGGSTKLSEGGIIIPVKTAILHPQHRSENEDYDVAILRLDTPFNLSSSIQPAKLPKGNEQLVVGWVGNVTGWGAISNNFPDMSDTLRMIGLPVLPIEWCKSRYISVSLTPRQFCAGFKEGGRDSCQGDSGGPFVINGTLYGIISWGFNCASPGYPGIYVNVAVLRDYIQQNSGI
ncbi:trypsin-2-like [Diabrotica virgifera virgifera]|uniref:Trypsin-2-like n=1 Tax=Diabrotica virgifera virgifera TaxID=50390 RepID=A0A6P7F6I6_DIAVI|nr:trypsin-2-like [Diabrotica virgifera virgifera]